MEKMHDYLLLKGFECFAKYKDTLGSYITEYFKSENRVAIIENIDNYQIMVYYNKRFDNFTVPLNDDIGAEKLKEVII